MSTEMAMASGYCMETAAEKAFRYGTESHGYKAIKADWVYTEDGSLIGWNYQTTWVGFVADARYHRLASSEKDWSAA